MKIMHFAAAAIGALLSLGIGAQPVRAETIFACTLRGGAALSVTTQGDRITYRYGPARHAALTIVGSRAHGNVFAWRALHGGATYWEQLRFVRGDYSYMVYSMPASRVLDSAALSGLVVMRARHKIVDRQCTRWTALSLFETRAPADAEGEPLAWDE